MWLLQSSAFALVPILVLYFRRVILIFFLLLVEFNKEIELLRLVGFSLYTVFGKGRWGFRMRRVVLIGRLVMVGMIVHNVDHFLETLSYMVAHRFFLVGRIFLTACDIFRGIVLRISHFEARHFLAVDTTGLRTDH
jgi:hypothetical protein